MSMDSISIALSGLRAQSQRLSVAATNIANASVSGPVPEDGVPQAPGAQTVYRPLEVQQSSLVVDGQGGGTTTTVTERDPGFTVVTDPDSVFADENGLVAIPSVDFASEFVDMLLAKNVFKANAKVIQVSQEIQDDLLDILV